MTPDMVYTLHHHARDGAGQAVDLGAIRRTEAIIDLLARRRLLRPHGLHDPAVALLSALAADVDSPAEVAPAASGAAPAASGAAPAGSSWAGAFVPGRASADPFRDPADGSQGDPSRVARRWEQRPAAGQYVPAASWTRAAAVVAVAATVAGAATTGVLVTGMLARLARLGVSPAGGMRSGGMRGGGMRGGAGARRPGVPVGVRPGLALPPRRPR